ncbi:MAG: hypothetical protein QY331_15095 [Melioribacteraceae bacterium]|jgi:tRNA A-37 threonylcarbamoyl transferase component Bud32|nr:hypothetical protein [Melioribacteraceae bacterium]RJP60035.1 MAG: hypothetical protein C4543_05660 [Ignavibacteriales bacterium]WKZ69286.1 MAG: hypothetical protein QY331_15095 [Melioribacteraceae bacterium]
MKRDDLFKTEFGDFVIKSKLGRGKSGDSYLAYFQNEKYVIKVMHDENVSYYKWNQSKLRDEVSSYKTLSKLKINIPKLHYVDYKNNYLIKDFINGKVASQIIAEGCLLENTIKDLFALSNHLQKHKLNIDYFPNNFVISNEKLFYIDYELNAYDEKWNLENWGIYYWLNTDGFSNFLKTNDAKFINADIEKGIPIKEPFRDKVKSLIQKYSENWNG